MKRAGGTKVAYVRFATFSEGAHAELATVLKRLDRRGAKGLVLDLRGNGGGLLNEAVLSREPVPAEGPARRLDQQPHHGPPRLRRPSGTRSRLTRRSC